MRGEGHRMGHNKYAKYTVVPVLYFTSTIFLQYVDFSLGFHENCIFQWPFAVNFKKLNIFIKKLNIFIKCFAFREIFFEFYENSPKFQFREGKFRETRY